MKTLLRFLMLVLLVITSSVNAAPSVSVAFVMDESGSVSASNFLLEKQGFINALNGVPSDGSVEVSAIGFASSSSVLVNPTVLTSASFASVKTTLENNSQSGGGTATDSAINTAAGLLASSVAPSRIICLATDGQPNDSYTATVAASNAKAMGINLAPIGIGLSSYGRTFLDSIASNPPVPNPATFTEFATVVRNDCIGAIKSALNIHMAPDTVDFGTFNSTTLASDIQVCGSDESVSVTNKSNQPAQITKIEFLGQDPAAYELVSFMGVTADKLSFPITLTPGVSATAKVKLNPLFDPVDGSYDGILNITGKDNQGVEGSFSTTLVAKVSASADSCLAMKVIDASPLISSISDAGEPLKKDKVVVGEIDVSLAIQNDSKGELERKGLVADGNARLLLVAKTRKSSGKVRFEITKPNSTEARLYGLKFNPTYKSGTREYDTNGKTILDLDIAIDPDGNGQVTAVLRAGERFLGAVADAKADFGIKACILDDVTGNCSTAVQEKPLEERKAPVILIHGLWSDNSAWFDDGNPSAGLMPRLREAEFVVGLVTYDGNKGPSETVRENKKVVQDTITSLCQTVKKNFNSTCSRADVVGHSMGGLFAREFIRNKFENENSTSYLSFNQGAVRRLITLGTPHYGSPLANILFADTIFQALPDDERKNTGNIPALVENNRYINDCIIHPEVSDWDSDGGYDEINDLVENLRGQGSLVVTGVRDLVVGSAFQSSLNSGQLNVPVFMIAGDIGQNYDQSLIVGSIYGTTIRSHTVGNAEKAGCDYANVLAVNSDGIVPIDSALSSNDFIQRYNFSGYVTLSDKIHLTTLQGFNHTGMGKEHPFINDDREMDATRPNLQMINQVQEALLSK